ncbi:MAG: 50S ribosomal protein L9 [Candidatus Marinimicrobia bacterium]|nr:50S ribosomal protein L9 [Candidatus Neomarinimicrobiota bacterium]
MKEVLLTADVPGVGAEGDIAQVKDGFARNYLLPQNLAAPVTAAARRRVEKAQRERAAAATAVLDAARALAAQIEQTSCTLQVQAGPEGKLFGSVTAQDLAAALEQQGLKVERHLIELAQPLRELGQFKVDVKLHPDVRTVLKVWLVEG